MDNEEAKFILRAYRPNGADAGNAVFCAALEQVRKDPELARWFQREQGLDKAVAERVHAIAVPANLRDAILAGASVSGPQTRRAWWRQPVWLAAAASVVLTLGVALNWRKMDWRSDWQKFGEFAASDLMRAENHDGHGEQRTQLQAILSQATTRLANGLTIEFEPLRASGCRVVKFGGREVLEVCFERGGKEFHLYAMRRAEPGDRGEGARYVAKNGAGALVWSDARFVYAVVGIDGKAALEALL